MDSMVVGPRAIPYLLVAANPFCAGLPSTPRPTDGCSGARRAAFCASSALKKQTGTIAMSAVHRIVRWGKFGSSGNSAQQDLRQAIR